MDPHADLHDCIADVVCLITAAEEIDPVAAAATLTELELAACELEQQAAQFDSGDATDLVSDAYAVVALARSVCAETPREVMGITGSCQRLAA